jgi:hypothetical protein
VRERRVDVAQLPPELGLVGQVEPVARTELHVEHVAGLAGSRLLPKHGKDLAVVGRPRRSAHAQDERVRRCVRRRQQVVHRLDAGALHLVDHQHSDVREANTEAGLSSTEQDARAVQELNLLLAVRAADAAALDALVDERSQLRHLRLGLHCPERLGGGAATMRRPDHRRPGLREAQTEGDAAHEVGLADLARQRHGADARGEHAHGVFGQDQPAEVVLPLVEEPAQVVAGVADLRPTRRDRRIRRDQVLREVS